jgi:division protein CdvB (Snf7/Vps24/ESCRT-III family)
MEARRERIYNFVSEHFEKEFENISDPKEYAKEKNIECMFDKFETEEELMKNQRETINEMNEEMISFLEKLVDMIPTMKYLDGDTLSMTKIEGLCFVEGKLVLILSTLEE